MRNKQTYIRNYLLSLCERSRRLSKGSYQTGFDWVIYQYGLSKNWLPVRYPFNIELSGKIITHKAEAEFGIDLCFYDNENKSIIVFLLKASRLTYKNWIDKEFDKDLRFALYPDLTNIEIDLKDIKEYKIITVYNQSDDKKGIEAYENLLKGAPKKIYENIDVKFERWNIDRLTEEVEKNLLTADVLPNNLSGLFSYISMQASDFEFGTKEWEYQLIPNWKNFLEQIFAPGVDEGRLNLIPFCLVILKDKLKNCRSSIIAGIDLIEYAMIKLWDLFPDVNVEFQKMIARIWRELYLNELIEYFNNNYGILTTNYGIKSKFYAMSLNAINASYIAYWHLGRLGILCVSMMYSYDEKTRNENLKYYCDYMDRIIQNNSACYYPLVDINHIELFLVFLAYLFNDNKSKLYDFFFKLGNYLCVRRLNKTAIPFIESANNLDMVAQYVATGNEPIGWNSKSSYLLTMLVEMFTIFDEQKAFELINYYFSQIIDEIKDKARRVDLVSWRPHNDWQERVFREQINSGVGIDTSNFNSFPESSEKNRLEIIKNFAAEARKKDIKSTNLNRPMPAYILACIKYKSPLPAEFWRVFINNL